MAQILYRKKNLSHRLAVLIALFVTLLWAGSWILIKIGLANLPPLTFAGLRYFLAWLCLLPFFIFSGSQHHLRGLDSHLWLLLVLQGLLYYSVTQGAQYIGLAYLPAIVLNIALNFTSILVAASAVFVLKERPTTLQWLAVVCSLLGALIYFFPFPVGVYPAAGIIAALVALLANSASALLGRRINSGFQLSAMAVTFVTMGIGGATLLGVGIGLQGLPQLTGRDWAMITWLAVINTALAFSLWNLTLQTLPAVESTMINSTLILQIPVLAVLFLGETMNVQQVFGLLLVAAGAVAVQLGHRS